MKYFIDTEFSERGPKHPIELISIGIVAEDGRELYCVNADFNPRHANQWVKDNVLPFLPGKPTAYFPYQGKEWAKQDEIRGRIQSFIGDDPSPEFWGYYCAYDWVVLCQLFGDMSCLPSGWPMYCHDLRQALDNFGFEDVKQSGDAPHDALQDARWIAETWRSKIEPKQDGFWMADPQTLPNTERDSWEQELADVDHAKAVMSRSRKDRERQRY